jgi:hypothetical protein
LGDMKTIFLLIIPILILTGCFGGGENDDTTEDLPGEVSEIDEVKQQVKVLEERRKVLKQNLAELKAKVPKSAAKPNSPAQDALQIEVQTYNQALEASVSKVEAQLLMWRDPMRKSFEGRVFKGFKMADGKVLDSVQIDQVTDDFVKIQDPAGTRQINWAEIAPETRVALVHEPSVIESAVAN